MHTEIYKIKGREYKYQVKNYRVGKKVKHKKKYLGSLIPINKPERKRSTGRKPTIFVKGISSEEKQFLKKAVKSSNSFIRDRAKIVLLSSVGLSSKQIVQKTNFEKRKVRKAIKEFNSKGIQALQRGKARGAIPKFNDVKKKLILMHFSKTPMSFGYHFTTWTLPRFRKHLIDYKVVETISIEKVRQILDEFGARLKRSKR